MQRRRATTTIRTYLTAAALLLGGAIPATADTTGEFGNECVMGLALGEGHPDRLLRQHRVQRQDLLLWQREGQDHLPQKSEEFLLKAQVYYWSKRQ